jgi:opacity protein-like surface antigen
MRWAVSAAAGLAAAFFSTMTANAESPWYLEGGAGGYFKASKSGADTFHRNATPNVNVPGVDTLKFNPGLMVNLGVGYRVTSHVRVEAEGSYFTYTGDTLHPFTAAPGYPALNGQAFRRQSGDRWTRYAGTVNAFYDIAPIGGRFRPYVGGGVGASANHRSNGLYKSATGQTFTASGGASTQGFGLVEGGVSIALSPHWSVAPAYRYVHYFSGADEVAHVAKLGLRYSF